MCDSEDDAERICAGHTLTVLGMDLRRCEDGAAGQHWQSDEPGACVSVFLSADAWHVIVSRDAGKARVQVRGFGATLEAAIAEARDALCDVDGAHDALCAMFAEGGV